MSHFFPPCEAEANKGHQTIVLVPSQPPSSGIDLRQWCIFTSRILFFNPPWVMRDHCSLSLLILTSWLSAGCRHIDLFIFHLLSSNTDPTLIHTPKDALSIISLFVLLLSKMQLLGRCVQTFLLGGWNWTSQLVTAKIKHALWCTIAGKMMDGWVLGSHFSWVNFLCDSALHRYRKKIITSINSAYLKGVSNSIWWS